VTPDGLPLVQLVLAASVRSTPAGLVTLAHDGSSSRGSEG